MTNPASSPPPAELSELLDRMIKAAGDCEYSPHDEDYRATLTAVQSEILALFQRQRASYSVCPNCDTSWTGGEVESALRKAQTEIERLREQQPEEFTQEDVRHLRLYSTVLDGERNGTLASIADRIESRLRRISESQ